MKVSEKLDKGRVVAVPTDTLYGLITLLKYSNKIYEIKKRPIDKPLGLFVSDFKYISK